MDWISLSCIHHGFNLVTGMNFSLYPTRNSSQKFASVGITSEKLVSYIEIESFVISLCLGFIADPNTEGSIV